MIQPMLKFAELEKLNPKSFETLAEILRLPRRKTAKAEEDEIPVGGGGGRPSAEWLERQRHKITELTSRTGLCRPRSRLSITRYVMKYTDVESVAGLPESATLCEAHHELNPWAVAKLFVAFAREVHERAQLFREMPAAGLADVKTHVARLNAAHALWTSPEMFSRHWIPYSPPPANAEGAAAETGDGREGGKGEDQDLHFIYDESVRFRHVGSNCEACIMARMGGEPKFLAALRANMLARQRLSDSSSAKNRPLYRMVRGWIRAYQDRVRDRILDESDRVGQILRHVVEEDRAARRILHDEAVAAAGPVVVEPVAVEPAAAVVVAAEMATAPAPAAKSNHHPHPHHGRDSHRHRQSRHRHRHHHSNSGPATPELPWSAFATPPASSGDDDDTDKVADHDCRRKKDQRKYELKQAWIDLHGGDTTGSTTGTDLVDSFATDGLAVDSSATAELDAVDAAPRQPQPRIKVSFSELTEQERRDRAYRQRYCPYMGREQDNEDDEDVASTIIDFVAHKADMSVREARAHLHPALAGYAEMAPLSEEHAEPGMRPMPLTVKKASRAMSGAEPGRGAELDGNGGNDKCGGGDGGGGLHRHSGIWTDVSVHTTKTTGTGTMGKKGRAEETPPPPVPSLLAVDLERLKREYLQAGRPANPAPRPPSSVYPADSVVGGFREGR